MVTCCGSLSSKLQLAQESEESSVGDKGPSLAITVATPLSYPPRNPGTRLDDSPASAMSLYNRVSSPEEN